MYFGKIRPMTLNIYICVGGKLYLLKRYHPIYRRNLHGICATATMRMHPGAKNLPVMRKLCEHSLNMDGLVFILDIYVYIYIFSLF